MFLQTVFVSLGLLAFGAILCAFGFRLFVILLPVFAFFAGFEITAQAIQELFGVGFLRTASSWVFGFIVGLLFAVVAYLFYYGAVVILAGAVGYEIGVGILIGIGSTSGFLLFIVGLVLGLALAAAVVLLNLPKVLIIALTAFAGASMIVSGILVALGQIPIAALSSGVVGSLIRLSWFWTLVCLVVAAVGFAIQILMPSAYQVTPYGETQMFEPIPPTADAATPPTSAPGTGQGGLPAV
ncbi:MAG TPA: hypothetical protein VHI51_05590 [Ktedonobacterales bacterium]|jgi:hypothetical protein|nr:hypothetical protein [Ktedonobacterales bacterium]